MNYIQDFFLANLIFKQIVNKSYMISLHLSGRLNNKKPSC